MSVDKLVVWDDHHKQCKDGCVALRLGDGYSISMSNYPRNPEIMVFVAVGEDSPQFPLTESGLRQALAWIDQRRDEK